MYWSVVVHIGRQFIAAEDLLYSARHATYWDSLDAAVNCFMLAIEVWQKCGDHCHFGLHILL